MAATCSIEVRLRTFARVLVLALAPLGLAVSAAAQPSQVPDYPNRGWLDINLGGHSLRDEEVRTSILGVPTSTSERVTYPAPSDAAFFELGGGFRLNRFLAVGAVLNASVTEDPAALMATQRHPGEPGRVHTATGMTDDLERSEMAVHVSLYGTLVEGRFARLRVFAGPTVYSYEAQLVSRIRTEFVGNAGQPPLAIVGYDVVDTDETAFGWHAGADASVFVWDWLGFGAVVRYGQGRVEITDPLSTFTSEIALGGLQFGGGVHVRF